MTLAFSLTLLLSATLMFSVQPMAGKMLLPLVGGTPAGWIVAMAFFQVMLLAGYLFAHLLSILPPRAHGLMYLLGLLAGSAFLPIALASRAHFESMPGPAQVFILLTQALAVPFIALSATSSTIQRLFTTTRHESAGDPYFLYVASNLGSFAGLLLYPVIIEPMMGLDRQAQWFVAGYALLTVMAVLCLCLAGRKTEKKEASASAAALSGKRQMEWLVLAFIPSCLLMSVTTHITSDVISAPLIWILPLAFYLVTFIIAFAKKPVISLRAAETLHPYAISIGIVLAGLMPVKIVYSWWGVLFYIIIFTVAALACHLRLASLRPLNNSRHLTAFYLMMSIGGALGGVLNAFIIPVVFSRLIEFPLTLLASFLVHREFQAKSRTGMALIAMLAVSLLLVNAAPPDIGVLSINLRVVIFEILFFILAGVLSIQAFFIVFTGKTLALGRFFRPSYMVTSMAAVFMIAQFLIGEHNEILSTRNFFGTIRVHDTTELVDGKPVTLRIMRHGSTLHGKQIVGAPLNRTPTAYYTREGPLGDIFRAYKPRKVAVLGLGAGATNCHSAPDREFTFFDIDPAVVRIAQSQFTFLSDCVSKKPPRIVVGDARLELAKLDDKFDLIVIDVFTSDSIPTHIITQEALKIYFDRLAPGGVVAVHVSNRYFALWNAISTTAATLGLRTQIRADLNPEMPVYSSPSVWLAIRRKDAKSALPAQTWKTIAPSATLRPWTDNYTNILSTLALTHDVKDLLP